MWPIEGSSLHFYTSPFSKASNYSPCITDEGAESCHESFPRAPEQEEQSHCRSSVEQYPAFTFCCRFSWKPRSFGVTFSSPPTESAFSLPFGMQGNRTPCEALSLSQSLVLLRELSDRIERFSCRHRVVSGLSGRNLGGRAQSLKPQCRSHTEKRILGTHSREEKPLSPLSLNLALRCCGDGGCSLAELELLGTASTGRLFPASLMEAATFSLLPRGWHSQGWELMWKYPACSDSGHCSCS